ncbi:Ger(x)C family spore germination protein [Thermotalea metallivorans]|uniref:Spore germination protein B3 n=1 Tax=Thermotalea metallivorans TaxID=520762 RepID=A0A140L2G3_9FIRM|nr:Ger(x)C family spore germination protein [Thermotalea metallivorans]KXG74738.1 Spore germination protein B3 [Thermotalea metallivorans]
MRYRKDVSFFCIICISSLFLGGCWNYKEISEKAVVIAVAVDYDEEKDEIVMSAEIASPMQRKDEMMVDSEVITSNGKNFFDAVRNSIGRIGKRMFWSHAKVLIIGETLVSHEDKFISVLDWFKRDHEVRDDIWLLYSKEKTAKEIFMKTDEKLYKVVGLYLEDMLRNRKNISKYPSVPLYKFVDDLANEGISPTLPTVELRRNKGQIKSELTGTAVFQGSKLVGWLNPMETRAYLFVIDQLEGGVMVIQDQWNQMPIRATLEVFQSKTKVQPVLENDIPIIKIDIKTTVNIAEIDTEIDIFSEENRMKFKRQAERKMEREIQSVIQKVQKDYQSDIFGFGATIQREEPKQWEKLQPHWDTLFPRLRTEVNVELDIRGSALRSKSIRVED